MNGFNDEHMGKGSLAGEWLQDTNETFSKRASKSYGIKGGKLYFDVYRFEIERGRQIAGNVLAGVIGAINCSQGSKERLRSISSSSGTSKARGMVQKEENGY